MISLDRALACYREQLTALPAGRLTLEAALGAALAEPLGSRVDLPPFTQSAMDGYAVRSADLAGGDTLICDRTRAAAPVDEDPALAPGHCARIFTGAALPPGADAVVIQEEVSVSGDSVRFRGAPSPGANVRPRGEDCARGDVLLPAGLRLRPHHLALAAAAGHAELGVRPPPRVQVLVTGDELTPPGAALAHGQVYECNGSYLAAWLRARHCPVRTARCADDADALRAQIEAGLADADLVLVSGGASVGDRDYGRDAALAAGVREQFWKVAQKPGKPLWFGTRGTQAVLILPGNPGSVFACAEIHLRAVLDGLQGVPAAVFRRGPLAASARADGRRERLLRARWREDGLLPLGGQASHRLSNLAECDALLRIPAGQDLAPGTPVDWLPV